MTSSTPPSIDLLTCSASDLSNWLLEHRFENDGMATTTFLLQGTSTLPNADEIAQQIQESAAGQQDDDDDDDEKPKKEAVALVSSTSEESTTKPNNSSIGEALHDSNSPLEVSLTNPRGRFHWTFHAQGIHAATIKNPQSLIVPAGSVRNVIVFPKPTDCTQISTSSSKKAASNAKSPMVLLCFHDASPVTFKNKPISQICFPIPTTTTTTVLQEILQQALPKDDDNDNNNTTEAWIKLICHSLQLDASKAVYRIQNPAAVSTTTAASTATHNKPVWTFKSHQDRNLSSTASGMPFVKCYHGVQDGVLFPMKQGLLFFKPPLFVPRSKLHSIACGRGTGASSRYVDMKIVTAEDNNNGNDDEEDDEEPRETTLEFTNIAREELTVLNDYIHKVLIPAMKQDSEQQQQPASTDEESAEDAVAVVDADDSDNEGTRRGRSKRKAAREARQQTKQHFLQKKKGNDQDDNDDEEDDEDEDSDEDLPYFSGGEEEEEDEDVMEIADAEDDEEEDDEEEEETTSNKNNKPGANGESGDADEEADDDDDDDVVEVVAEVDATESDDGDETEEDQEDENPPSKKRRSK
ncbi:expressed unknown protein [Seminavis robusta]|uniref:Histone chaperone RTT106/FACT complex subunit SPT16-like middle domain-containing protein n=1 Tax=Seminavis robusta TaxID=568900 RepID=A0A9N8DXD2_9STRA|nr:expressed unknown protein [Seminavis robusta]|eukprot:Sro440_g143510.1 n/a (580) ;mRNA; f:40455-42407